MIASSSSLSPLSISSFSSLASPCRSASRPKELPESKSSPPPVSDSKSGLKVSKDASAPVTMSDNVSSSVEGTKSAKGSSETVAEEERSENGSCPPLAGEPRSPKSAKGSVSVEEGSESIGWLKKSSSVGDGSEDVTSLSDPDPESPKSSSPELEVSKLPMSANGSPDVSGVEVNVSANGSKSEDVVGVEEKSSIGSELKSVPLNGSSDVDSAKSPKGSDVSAFWVDSSPKEKSSESLVGEVSGNPKSSNESEAGSESIPKSANGSPESALGSSSKEKSSVGGLAVGACPGSAKSSSKSISSSSKTLVGVFEDFQIVRILLPLLQSQN